MKRIITLILVFIILLGSAPFGTSALGASGTNTITTRTVPLTIKIVLVGFDPHTLDQDYLTWKGNTVQNSINHILSTGNITGITYELTYDFVYVIPEFYLSLTKFLKSIEQRKLTYNPWFRSITNNTFYDAGKVEDWFIANREDYGGFPTSGYTFIFANMTNLPSVTEAQLETESPTSATPHYYTTQYVDKDLDYRIRYRDFSVGWGGRNRLWFLDMAAGPEFWTWTNSESVPHIPMQLAIDLYRLNVHSSYGKQWLTQYLADYIYDAVLNLAVPVFTYQPAYSRTYRIVVNVIDNRTEKEKKAIPIQRTIRPDLAKQAFMELLPYAEVKLETHFVDANNVPSLQATIIESTVTPPADLGIGRYVDTRPVYRFLQEHLSDLVGTTKRDESEFTIPVFAFAFTGGVYFGYTFKWYIASLELDTNNFFGLTLEDMILIGLSQTEFRRGDSISPPQPGKGIGFTQVLIHEGGHALGLMHPHQFGYLGDFEASAMSYWAWEYKFSQFDKDALNRAHADQLINSAISMLTEAQTILSSKLDLGIANARITSARSLLDNALRTYNSMRYTESVETAYGARSQAADALALVISEPNGVFAAALVFLVVGIVIGSTMIFVALRKYAQDVAERG